ncbi:MAG: hypothetical protein HY698_05565 [Deltaproteobacteria bacterium]|nr:hypothetical protein [Deltaproteobacteria bacterium]
MKSIRAAQGVPQARLPSVNRAAPGTRGHQNDEPQIPRWPVEPMPRDPRPPGEIQEIVAKHVERLVGTVEELCYQEIAEAVAKEVAAHGVVRDAQIAGQATVAKPDPQSLHQNRDRLVDLLRLCRGNILAVAWGLGKTPAEIRQELKRQHLDITQFRPPGRSVARRTLRDAKHVLKESKRKRDEARAIAESKAREQLLALLGKHHGNVTAVAQVLGKAPFLLKRELRNYRIGPDEIRATLVPKRASMAVTPSPAPGTRQAQDRTPADTDLQERERLIASLRQHQGNVRAVARDLRTAPILVRRKAKRCGVDISEFKPTPDEAARREREEARLMREAQRQQDRARRDEERTKDRERLVALLRQHQGNIAAVARDMGKAPVQIRRKLTRYGLDIGQFRRGGGG